MESMTGRRATADVATAMAAFLAAGIWLSAAALPAEPPYLAMSAGAAIIGQAAASILRRKPRLCTPADRVTLARAVVVACCATLVVPGLLGGRTPELLLVLLGTAAYLLDAVDGKVARRTGCASPAGARLDSETDAALVLVLSLATAATVGPWTLAIGLMRYAFVAAGWFRPALRGPLQESRIRKIIGAFQPFALLLALTPGVPATAGMAAAILALATLAWSFGRDVLELQRIRRTRAALPAETAVPN